ncbi:MAG: response regulator [Bacteroidales bacterium]|nr:response regulator [Bacteroidales bacterium]
MRTKTFKSHLCMEYNWKNRTVLVVEDDEMSFRYIELVLSRRTNINIIWAINGQQAVEYCRLYNHIDLVLTDLQLPVFDGLEAIRRIRKFKPHLPIIVQTANAMNDEYEKCIKAGSDGYVTKPINLIELFTMMDRLLNPVTSHV